MSFGRERVGGSTAWRPSVASSRPRLVVAAAVVAVLLIGIGDYLSGPLWSMEAFYLLPVAVAAAFAGRLAGIIVASVAAVVGTLSDVVLDPGYAHRIIATLNVAFMFVTLLVVVLLIDRLRRHADLAHDAERQSREFLSVAAHQLRTPLAGILANVDALMVGSYTEADRERLLMSLGSETARASRLVNSLLRIARLDQHEPLPLRAADLNVLVRDELDRAARLRPSLAWGLTAGDPRLTSYVCNPDALAEAVANLLDNAGRHAASHIQVVVRSAGDDAEIVVRDDGPGLPAGKVDVAFERFISLDGRGGSGLGLPIARGIAEAHGGSLEYADRAFTMCLHGHALGERRGSLPAASTAPGPVARSVPVGGGHEEMR
jgi:signal transduction histidine kinase